MEETGFSEVEHTADWAFTARGRDLAELFRNAARAMFTLQGAAAGAPATITREVEVESGDRETLLVNWLNELLYLQEVHRETYQDFEVLEIAGQRLRARIAGRPGQEAHRLIKAVTFHGLEVKETPAGFEATIVVDV